MSMSQNQKDKLNTAYDFAVAHAKVSHVGVGHTHTLPEHDHPHTHDVTEPIPPEPGPEPEPEPTPEPPPALTGLYGPGIAGETLANTTTDQGPVSIRFIATKTAPLAAIRPYFEIGTGYSGGDGGRRVVTLVTDLNGKPSGQVLASGLHVGLPTKTGLSRFPRIDWNANVGVVEGSAYHVVFTNEGNGYISVNSMLMWQPDPVGQPRFAGWELARNGAVRTRYLPVLELIFADGSTAGNGYVNAFEVQQAPVGGANRVRVRFTPKQQLVINQIGIRCKRDAGGGSSPLAVSLAGLFGAIPGSTFPQVAPADWKTNKNQNAWGLLTIPTTTLPANVEQTLELGGLADTTFRTQAFQKGRGYGYSAYFNDGYAERSTNSGQTWQAVDGWSGPDKDYDIGWFVR